MKLSFILLFFVASISSQDLNITLDHVNIVVDNLDEAKQKYRQLGFTLKDGRQHSNSILNAFIKFSDGSIIELITAKSKKDDLSSWYVDFKQKFPKGMFAFIALRVNHISHLKKRLDSYGIAYIQSNYKYAEIISFAIDSKYHPIFFIKYLHETKTESKYLNHKNETKGIKSVWVNKSFKELFKNLGFSNFTARSDQILGKVDVLEFDHSELVFSVSKKYKIIGLRLKSTKKRFDLINYGNYLGFEL